MSTRDEYLASMKLQIDEWTTEIDAMEARADAVQPNARAEFQSQLAGLRAQRDNSENKLEEVRSASDGAWQRVKGEADNLWTAFKDSAAAFRAHYK
ncbi:MAG: hypothetical protein EA400_07070 [Chromatiaceae bacterium]|nr:MAG: hypothetical protein EA400_07070 [Chromatiaceae bacterium]